MSITENILVTGGCGFIGSWFIEWLLGCGCNCNIICLDQLTYCGNFNNISQPKNARFRFIQGSVCDFEFLATILAKHEISVVVHFAAESCVDRSFDTPLLFSQTNLIGTQTLLEVVRTTTNQVRKIVHISTDEVYGEQNDEDSVDETGKLNPTNPYSATKAATDLIINSYLHSYKMPIIMVRLNNVFGPKQYPEKIIPCFLINLIRGQDVSLHGDGHNKRKYIYIANAVDAIFTIMTKGKLGEIYNVGAEYEISNIELTRLLVEKFCELKDKPISGQEWKKHVKFVKDRLFNDSRYNIEYDKLKSLGWEEKVNFNEGLDLTIRWFLENGDNWWVID